MPPSTSPPPPPPPTASQTYKSLHETALGFLAAFGPAPSPSSTQQQINYSVMASHCSPAYTHSWGHNHAVSQSPPLQGLLSFQDFTAHLDKMVQRLASWHMAVTRVFVDEASLSVVVRATYYMVALGHEEHVIENDLIWVLDMEQRPQQQQQQSQGTVSADGAARLWITKTVEFVDAVATARLREIMMGKAGT
ncbi:hypothetical protein ACJQWK_00634 [Exserohilum turcicum]|uniref:Uncharacterized protein n=1 Tax=Exserohilum turcicum (strain 28A) TaxID=671987 RepID=R0IFD6_EXST2|nr:uncharacterized protein SETTUDRAFT_42731 [Exserohilum turcica Et28A]EOA83990.1 hypothetical protein SETTUDRAFT_42731 [Exserohilum turcica Et28A]